MSSDSEEWGYEPSSDEEMPTLSTRQHSSVSYTIMSAQEIEHCQERAKSIICDSFGFTPGQAKSLLRRYLWDIQKASEAITDGFFTKYVSLNETPKTTNHLEFCMLCYTQCVNWDMKWLDCGHMFCKNCYTAYLTEEIKKGVSCVFSKCPMVDCELIVPDDFYKELVNRKDHSRFKEFVVKSYVEFNPSIKWCPGPDCQYAASYPEGCSRDIVCRCGYVWCFSCTNEAHRPLDCEMLAKWQEHNAGKKDLTGDWIVVNTKNCPSCNSPIQKNQGCMHMTCACSYEFCWLCLGPWSEHGNSTGGFYKCNKFEENQKKGEYQKQEKERGLSAKKLQRYEYYFTRFQEHKNSTQLARRKKQEVLDLFKVKKTDDPNYLNFLLNATNTIIESRSGICYSYPLGFFLNSVTKLRLFEFIQGELEQYLEKLDKATENTLESLKDRPGLTGDSEVESINELNRVVRYHFEKCMQSMEAGLPEVEESSDPMELEFQTVEDLLLANLDASQHWVCVACTFINANERQDCEICLTPRPQF